ncbi:DUF952 domain-containing protein [Rhodovibrio salinarum]|uniref:DUF952 domain-containing protein n=1 Tax=Rhodovibrio salinarum TaxID=1087 RepID=A0A934QMI4_9PROT|nr:DUF952 domain-containing protein [Rhodovibrio salinarum]MBK1699257.1 DUF952 domain-containing protein [Rhodovibrio salinarum]
MSAVIFHVCPWAAWRAAQAEGVYRGGPLDLKDGFIHFSTPNTLSGTLATYLAGQPGLCLLEVETDTLGDGLVWEESRGGVAFPHLYATLDVAAVRAVHDLPLNAAGVHVLPAHAEQPAPDMDGAV